MKPIKFLAVFSLIAASVKRAYLGESLNAKEAKMLNVSGLYICFFPMLNIVYLRLKKTIQSSQVCKVEFFVTASEAWQSVSSEL